MSKKINLTDSIEKSSKNLLNATKGAALTQDLGALLKISDDVEKDTLIDTKDIQDNPFQPRIDINEKSLQELADSIEKEGQLQPIIVQKNKEKYIVIAGHRRLYAHRLLNKKNIWAHIISKEYSENIENNQLLFRQAAIENIQRDQLYPLELAISCKEALDKGLYKTKEEISKALNKSKSYIVKIMSILKLKSTIIDDLIKNKIIKDVEALYELQKIKDFNKQEKLYKLLKEKKITRDDIRKEVKKQNKNIATNFINIKKTKQKISLFFNIGQLNQEKISQLENEINKLIKKINV